LLWGEFEIAWDKLIRVFIKLRAKHRRHKAMLSMIWRYIVKYFMLGNGDKVGGRNIYVIDYEKQEVVFCSCSHLKSPCAEGHSE
jgi:hypothetical protein